MVGEVVRPEHCPHARSGRVPTGSLSGPLVRPRVAERDEPVLFAEAAGCRSRDVPSAPEHLHILASIVASHAHRRLEIVVRGPGRSYVPKAIETVRDALVVRGELRNQHGRGVEVPQPEEQRVQLAALRRLDRAR